MHRKSLSILSFPLLIPHAKHSVSRRVIDYAKFKNITILVNLIHRLVKLGILIVPQGHTLGCNKILLLWQLTIFQFPPNIYIK